MKLIRARISHIGLYGKALLKWLVLAGITGVLCGLLGAAFHLGINYVTRLRQAHTWLLWCLPLAGLAVVGVYRLTNTQGQGTDDIIDAVHRGKELSPLLIPAIWLGTVLTHLCGGSSGREGAALQIGGDIGYQVGRLFRLDDRDLRTVTLCGMAAFFSALFGTPLAAAVFAIVVISVGVFYHVALIPCFTASLVSYGISLWMGVEPTRFRVAAPALGAVMMLRVAVFGVSCALISMLFCNGFRFVERRMRGWMPNPWLRAAVGGAAVIALTYLSGTTDYNGAGMDVVAAAIQNGTAHPTAFLWKLLFTAVTLGAGFKGGEIVPAFFVGSTFGCVAAPLLGIPAGFGAALGLVSVFCGITNCPMASLFLSIELFGSGGVLYFAMSCFISYMLSGYNGLYSSQTIVYSKLKAQYINVHTNAHHAGQMHGDMIADPGSPDGSAIEERKTSR